MATQRHPNGRDTSSPRHSTSFAAVTARSRRLTKHQRNECHSPWVHYRANGALQGQSCPTNPGRAPWHLGIINKARAGARYDFNMDDQARPFANGSEHEFTLTIEEAADRYAAAGHPRTIRAIQKYCARGDLECQKAETAFGQRYLITAASIARHIAQIIDVSQAPGRVQPRTDASVRSSEVGHETAVLSSASVREQPRTDVPDERYVAQLESDNVFLKTQLAAKDTQLASKDTQIAAFLERDHETNALIQGLQRMLLLSAPEAGNVSRPPGEQGRG